MAPSMPWRLRSRFETATAVSVWTVLNVNDVGNDVGRVPPAESPVDGFGAGVPRKLDVGGEMRVLGLGE